MPAGREGRRGTQFSFALPPLNFDGTGGREGSGFRWIATFGGGESGMCMPACREGERTKLCFCAYAVQLSRTGGRLFREISTIDGGAFGGLMRAGR